MYLEQDSEIRRAVGVIKTRDSNHEKGIRQFVVAAHGVEIQGRLDSLTGLLGWSALRESRRRNEWTPPGHCSRGTGLFANVPPIMRSANPQRSAKPRKA